MAWLTRHNKETNDLVQGANGNSAPTAFDKKFDGAKDTAIGATQDLAAVFNKSFGKDLSVLADPHSSPLACAKAFGSLAEHTKELFSIKGVADKASDFALKRIEREELPKVERAIHAGKFGEGTVEIKESIEKVRTDIENLTKGGMSTPYHAYQLNRDLGKLEKQMNEAAEHLHGARGEHAMAPGGAGQVAVVPSPLDALQVGSHATIGPAGPTVDRSRQQAPEVGRA